MPGERPPGTELTPVKLEDVGDPVVFPPGARIVGQGEDPRYFYLIRQGRVKVFRENREGIRTDLTLLGPGEYFGEVALVTGQPRTASVEAVTETSLIRVSKEEFDWVLDHNPQLARSIIQQLSHWLVAGDHRLEKEVVHQVHLRKISWFDYALLLGLSLILAVGFNFSNPNRVPLVQGWGEEDTVPRIEPNKALELVRAQARAKPGEEAVLIIDARPANFFNQKRIKGAKNLPLPLFDFLYLMQFSQVPKEKPLIVYGRNISRHYDLEVARKLILRGHEQVMVLGGGPDIWKADLFPLEP